ncbi:TRAF3-interacting protein 1 [Orchesella cincta]|uniref:TRAF3-interacting protein 1 n=1 Tax=Orchesella cincta TaxID=48709 RepID=A0A1D2MLL1_ORCCI|nr:TRAF3-interacting protein 1 [Orchesella cincta]
MAVNSYNPRLGFSSNSSENNVEEVFHNKFGMVGTAAVKCRSLSEPIYQMGKDLKKDHAIGRNPALSDSSNVLKRTGLPSHSKILAEQKAECSTICEELSQSSLIENVDGYLHGINSEAESTYPEPESVREWTRNTHEFTLEKEEDTLRHDNSATVEEEVDEMENDPMLMRDVVFESEIFHHTETEVTEVDHIEVEEDDDNYPEIEHYPSGYGSFIYDDIPMFTDTGRFTTRSCDESFPELPDDILNTDSSYFTDYEYDLTPADMPTGGIPAPVKVVFEEESETNEKCEARPSKILSGKEPEKTNDMLQLLAKAITSYKSKDKAKLSMAKVTSSKTKPSQKAVVDNKVERTKPEAHQDTKRARSRPPAKNLTSQKSNSQEKAQEKSRFEVSKNKTDSKKVKANVKENADEVTNIKTVSQNSSSAKKSDESLKTNKPSSTTACIPNQATASSLSKSVSKLSLKKKPSSLKLVTGDTRKSVNPAEKVSSHEVTPGSSDGKNKNLKRPEILSNSEQPSKSALEGTNNTAENSADTSSLGKTKPRSNTGLPPELMEEIPSERPVTRKKLQNYNDNNDSNENPNRQDNTKNDNVLKSATSEEQVSATPMTPESTLPATTTEQKGKNKSGCSSSTCTSSDEGVTEEMNKKISEWKDDSGGVVAVVDSLDSLENMDYATGWIPQSQSNSNIKTRTSSYESVHKVFNRRESCSQQCEDEDNVSISNRKAKTSISSHQDIPMKRPITVILDNHDFDEDDETFLVQEKTESETDLTLDRLQSVLMNTAADIAHIPQEHRGLLVNQIMETQRELEQLSSQKSMFATLQNEMAERDKEALREVYLKQIEDLKGAIQKMAKCANPLANIIQRSQDDACLMEIEFRKLRQENERLQRKIDDARLETTRVLFPMTEELAHLDSRIEKMEGAIVLAKQRLHLMDDEYHSDYICPIAQCPTQDEGDGGKEIPIWEFKEGNSSEEDEGGVKKTKSLLDVFRKAVSMHENEAYGNGHSIATASSQQPMQTPLTKSFGRDGVCRDERYCSNMGMPMNSPRLGWGQGMRYSENTFSGQRNQPQFHSTVGAALRGYGDLKENPLGKDIKPPWWD